MNDDEWSLDNCIMRGCLPTGEPIEALYGGGWWTEEGQREQEPDIIPRPGDFSCYEEYLSWCKNNGIAPVEESKQEDDIF